MTAQFHLHDLHLSWALTRWHILWSLLIIFHGHSTQEPALISCNDEQGGLIYSVAQQGKTVLAKSNATENIGRRFGNMKVGGPGTNKFKTRNKCLALTKHAWLYSDLLQALKGEHLSAPGSQQRGLQLLHPQGPTAGLSDRQPTGRNRHRPAWCH